MLGFVYFMVGLICGGFVETYAAPPYNCSDTIFDCWEDIIPDFWFKCILFPPEPEFAPIDEERVSFFLYTKSNPDLPLEMVIGDPLSTFFDRNAPVKIISHGYLSDHNSGTILKDAYLSLTTNTNVILVDWSSLLSLDYCVAAENTRLAGKQIAQFIEYLVSLNVKLDKFHLIGHSLGAHVVSFAAKEFVNPKLRRLTALDPAYPSFQKLSDADRLAPSDAEFVDVIHTNGQDVMEANQARLGLGFTDPRGHADFYPNGGHLQPGCYYWIIEYVCSHGRAWDLLAESIKKPKAFPARECSGWRAYNSGDCAFNETVYMGEGVAIGSSGLFFLDTHHETPFGKGTEEDACFGYSCPTKPEIKKVKCTLEWVSMAMGDELPASAVPTSEGNKVHYYARALMGEIGNDKYVGGRYEDGSVFTVLNGEAVVNGSYDILTNPHNCILTMATQLSNIVVPVVTGYHSYLGRASIQGQLLGGEVSGGRIHIAGGDEQVHILDKHFEILQSHRLGLDLEIMDFIFDTDIFSGAKDFFGMEEIVNNARTTVSQTITHSKTITQSNSFVSTTMSSHAVNVCLHIAPEIEVAEEGAPSLKVSGPKLDLCYKYNENNREQKSHNQTTSYQVSVTREVIVPPLTSVKLCSSVQVVEYFKIGFTATGRYSAPGLSAEEVAELLKEDGKFGVADGNAVLVAEEGTFSGRIAFSPQFVVVPYGEIGACSNLN